MGKCPLLLPYGSGGSNSGPQACRKYRYSLSHLTASPQKILTERYFLLFSACYSFLSILLWLLLKTTLFHQRNSLAIWERKKNGVFTPNNSSCCLLSLWKSGVLPNILNASLLSAQCTELLLLCIWTSQKRSNVACRHISFQAEVRIRTHDGLPISPQCPQHQHYSQHLYLYMGSFRLTQLSTPVKNSKNSNKPVFFSCPLFWRLLRTILLRKSMVTRTAPHTPHLPPLQFWSGMFSEDTSVKLHLELLDDDGNFKRWGWHWGVP